jgi:hypothetical protein
MRCHDGTVSFFRRRRRRARVNVGTFNPPERAPIAPIDHVVEDGVLISMWSVRMAIKNRLIVGALRDDERFDADALVEAAREEALAIAQENVDTADRLEDRRETLDALEDDFDFDLGLSTVGAGAEGGGGRTGAGRGGSDPVREDEEHRRRPRVHRQLATALRARAEDAGALADLVEGARQDAMDEIGREILKRAEAQADTSGFLPASDEDYESERQVRLRMLLDFDLVELEREARRPPGRSAD